VGQVDQSSRRQALTDPMLNEHALRRAVESAVLEHKRAGNSIAVWRDGKVVVVPAEDIVISEVGKSLP